jgi:hypothetical protein
MYENRIMKPVEIALRRAGKRETNGRGKSKILSEVHM